MNSSSKLQTKTKLEESNSSEYLDEDSGKFKGSCVFCGGKGLLDLYCDDDECEYTGGIYHLDAKYEDETFPLRNLLLKTNLRETNMKPQNAFS